MIFSLKLDNWGIFCGVCWVFMVILVLVGWVRDWILLRFWFEGFWFGKGCEVLDIIVFFRFG